MRKTSVSVVSVIVPVYNSERWLRQCLDSIINQTWKNLEIICVNDGSEDNSGRILDEYAAADERVKVIHQPNSGVSKARNVGLGLAAGDFISFVDSDDWLAVDFYEKMMKEVNEQTEIVQGGVKFYGGDNRKVVSRSMTASEFTAIIGNMKKCYVCNKLWKRSFIIKNRLKFAEDVSYCEDVLFTVAAAFYAGQWKFTGYTGYFYRINPSSATKSSSGEENRRRNRFKVLEKSLSFGRQKNFSAEYKRMLEKFLIRQLVDNKDVTDRKRAEKLAGLFDYPELLSQKYRKSGWKQYLFYGFRWLAACCRLLSSMINYFKQKRII